jgi:hypothetical protein
VAKRWGRQLDQEEIHRRVGELSATMFPVACGGDGCEARTTFFLPGDSPYTVGAFFHKGWTALVDHDTPTVTFVCPKCFKKEVEAHHVEGHTNEVSG